VHSQLVRTKQGCFFHPFISRKARGRITYNWGPFFLDRFS